MTGKPPEPRADAQDKGGGVMEFWAYEEQDRNGVWKTRKQAGENPRNRHNRPPWQNVRHVREITSEQFCCATKLEHPE